MRKYVIGLSTQFMEAHLSIWGAGIYQNIFLLYQLLSKSPLVSDVVLVDFYSDALTDEIRSIYGKDYRTVGTQFAADRVDIMIEVGVMLPIELAALLRQRGAKVVALRLGNTYIDEVMSVFDCATSPNPLRKGVYDEFWVSPHHAKMSAPMLETIYRVPVKVAPYIWDKQFCDRMQQERPLTPSFGFKKGQKIQRIAVCEPSISPVKTFHIPTLILEELYNNHPTLITGGMLMGTWHYIENKNVAFNHFMGLLNITQAGKLSAENRLDLIQLLSLHAQMIISHQWENALNYLVFDALYGGYPVVHNAEPLKNYGYYYPDFDTKEGARVAYHAIKHHSDQLDAYRDNNQTLFWRYNMDNPVNLAGYDQLILNLFAA